MNENNDYALVLSGGGARGAYQAGALRAVYEIAAEVGNLHPFRNLIGVSAGAINAAYLAAEIDDLDRATSKLTNLWRGLTTTNVFRTDYVTVGRTGFRFLRALTLGGFSDKLRPSKMGLLNINPLNQLLQEHIHFQRIPEHIQQKRLNALCVTATDYSTALGVTFFCGDERIKEWKRVHRVGVRSEIGIDHIMASASIPIFFPPWPVGKRHFGDGCLRNTAPLSPARKIGANKLLVIGVRRWKDEKLDDATIIRPSLGRVVSVLINAIFMDAVEVDIERVRIINENLQMSGRGHKFRKIDILYMQPSHPLSELVESRYEGLPPILKFLISGLGSPRESAEILSYLAFEPLYLNSLVDLGYEDTMKQKEILIQFLAG